VLGTRGEDPTPTCPCCGWVEQGLLAKMAVSEEARGVFLWHISQRLYQASVPALYRKGAKPRPYVGFKCLMAGLV
jgi:hypothetical protein